MMPAPAPIRVVASDVQARIVETLGGPDNESRSRVRAFGSTSGKPRYDFFRNFSKSSP
jgi:hypothetical protein